MSNNFFAAAVQGFLSFVKESLFRKKQYCLWLWGGDHWRNLNPAGNSEHRCREALNRILGQNPGHSVQWIILPKNFSPPERNVWDGDQ